MIQKIVSHLAVALLIIITGCSEESSPAGDTSSAGEASSIEVIESNYFDDEYFPSKTLDSTLVLFKSTGGFVYNEATDEELYFDTVYTQDCVKYSLPLWLDPDAACVEYNSRQGATFQIPLVYGENRIYMYMTRDTALQSEPTFVTTRIQANRTNVINFHADCPAYSYSFEPPIFIIGENDSDLLGSCFHMKASESGIYRIDPYSSSLTQAFIIYDGDMKLVTRVFFPWTVEVILNAGQEIFIETPGSYNYHLGFY